VNCYPCKTICERKPLIDRLGSEPVCTYYIDGRSSRKISWENQQGGLVTESCEMLGFTLTCSHVEMEIRPLSRTVERIFKPRGYCSRIKIMQLPQATQQVAVHSVKVRFDKMVTSLGASTAFRECICSPVTRISTFGKQSDGAMFLPVALVERLVLFVRLLFS
jgi:hypothetical protein